MRNRMSFQEADRYAKKAMDCGDYVTVMYDNCQRTFTIVRDYRYCNDEFVPALPYIINGVAM